MKFRKNSVTNFSSNSEEYRNSEQRNKKSGQKTNNEEFDPQQLILLPKNSPQNQFRNNRNKVGSYNIRAICGIEDNLIERLYSKNSEHFKLMVPTSKNILEINLKENSEVSDLIISLNSFFIINSSTTSVRYIKEKCDNALEALSKILEIDFRFRTPTEKALDDVKNFIKIDLRSGEKIIDDPRIIQFHFYNLFAQQIREHFKLVTFNHAKFASISKIFNQEWVLDFQQKHETFIGHFLKEMFDECQKKMPETSLESFKEECLPQLQKIETLTAIEKSRPLQSIGEEDKYFSKALRNLSANTEKLEPSVIYSENLEQEISEDEKSQDDSTEVRKPTFSSLSSSRSKTYELE